ncbi:hypothetical protein FCOIX_7926 [Fusarium coicis]|nr:hypothetical protein FCOIX_7926 [Fusarium coicis]
MCGEGRRNTWRARQRLIMPKERRLMKLRQRCNINLNARENHWTSLFGLGKSPVVLIFTAAMPSNIYCAILCGPPKAVTALVNSFYSTLGKDGVKASLPKTFCTMLTLPLLTSLTSAVTNA